MESFNSIVFDIDGTLARSELHDYDTATVIRPIANKLQDLHSKGYRIILFTSRGATSQNGDMELIEEHVRPVVETWLHEHGIPFDELRFGKPLGAIYIDDKSCDLPTFLAEDIDVLTHRNPDLLIAGASGLGLELNEEHVVKKCHTAREQVKWLDNARRMGVDVPKVYMLGDESYTMERLSGISLSNCVKIDPFLTVLGTVDGFKHLPANNNVGFDWFIRKVEGRLAYIDDEALCDKIVRLLRNAEGFMDTQRSFCHEDMLFGNVIYTEDERTVFLDPTSTPETFNSWLMDVSKMMVSCDSQYERDILGYRNNPVMPFISELIMQQYSAYRPQIRLLQACRIVQLLHYIESEKHTLMITKIKELIDEL